jgi:hypothetical protein
LAEFLKTTGPDDIRTGSVVGIAHPVSPLTPKRKNAARLLLKLAVGKSASSRKDDASDVSTASKSPDNPARIAEAQFTAAGRKYYAIKVDYPFIDDSSISNRPLLGASTPDPRSDTMSEMDYHAIMAMKKHHRLSSVLASDTSMEFLNDGTDTRRNSGRYTSYPPSRARYSLTRSNSLSEISPADSFRDDGSIVPGDSVSLRPVYAQRTRVVPPKSETIPRSTTDSSATITPQDREPPISAPSPTGTLELMESLDMLDKLRKQRFSSDNESMASKSTTRSLQHRRRAKRIAQQFRSSDISKTEKDRQTRTSRSSPADLNSKSLPFLPPHKNGHADTDRQARAAAVAAALSPRLRLTSEPSAPSISVTHHSAGGSLESYAIPEDDVLSLRSGISAYRSHRRDKVRDKKKKDLDDERERKLDDAMKMLQKDVQMKNRALDREADNESIGSRTPQPLPSPERLRTPPNTPPPPPPKGFGISPIATILDCPPSGPRRKPSSPQHSISSQNPSQSDSRPKTSNSQRTVFTNGPITPVSSAPSSPTKSQYNNRATQPIPQLVSLPPNYPPPNPSPSHSSRTTFTNTTKLTDEEDRETRIAALEEQKWVLEQALRVLLNQQSGPTTPIPSPILGYMERSPPKSNSSDR